MTYDKQNNGHIAKPFTPTLSSAFNRTNKSPLTPKLANPTTVRGPKRLAPSDHPATTPSRQGPEPSYLSANVTPRSGSRSSRRDGPILSPASTPVGGVQSPHSPFVQPSPVNGANTRVYRTDRSPVRMGPKLEPPRVARAKTLTADLNTARPHSTTELPTTSARFFHASDARSVSGSSDADTRSKVSTKSASPATFFHADGQEETRGQAEESSRRRSSGLSRPAIVTRPSAPPRMKSPKLNATSPRFSDTLSSSSIPQLEDSPEIGSPVRSPPLSTVRPVPVISHTKSSSVDTARGTPIRETPAEPLRPSPFIVSALDSQLGENNPPDATPALRPRIFSNGSTNSFESQNDGLQSPTKSEPGNSGPVLSARVERKILDLEISNSSLLAINRTLEREMRKQNAELRRFRRLSRSGRLSVAPSRSVSGNLSIHTEVEEGESELSSMHSPEDLSDMSDDESMMDESSLGPDSTADDNSQQRNKDEKRFLVDLTKHQELLADSQKMNQSLKRCLGWTEELIKEGQKALEYNVHVSDIQLGGRVLSPDDMTEDGETGRGLLAVSPGAEPEMPNIVPPGEDEPPTST